MSGAFLFFVSDGLGWNVNISDANGSYLLGDHVYSLQYPPIVVPGVGHVCFVRDELGHAGVPTGYTNYLCIWSTEPFTHPIRAGSYPLYSVNQAFSYPANVRLGIFDLITLGNLQRELDKLLAPPPLPLLSFQPILQPLPPTPMLQVPAVEWEMLNRIVQTHEETIARLQEQVSASSGSRSDSSPQVSSPVPSGVETPPCIPSPELPRAVSPPRVPSPVLLPVRAVAPPPEFADLIAFYTNTAAADEFMRAALSLCTKFPGFDAVFAANAANQVGPVMLLACLSKNVELDPHGFVHNIYMAFYDKLAILIKGGIQNSILANLTIDENGWRRIKLNVHIIFEGEKATQVSAAIGTFCDIKIAEVKATAKQQAILPQPPAAPTPAAAKQSAQQLLRSAKKKAPKGKTRADAEDEFFADLEREQLQAKQAVARATAIEAAKPLQQRFAEFASKLEGTDDSFILNLTIAALDPAMLSLTNAHGENLLLIALRNIKHRISIEIVNKQKQLTTVAKGYRGLLAFLIDNSNVAHTEDQNRSALFYMVIYGANVPQAMAAEFFISLLNTSHARTPQHGETFLHKLLENPNNIGVVLIVVTYMLEGQDQITTARILQLAITPLLIARHKGMNIRAKIEQVMVEQLQQGNRLNEKDFIIALKVLDRFYIKLGPVMSGHDYDDFFNLTSETNIIEPLLAAAANGNNGKPDRATISILTRILSARNTEPDSLRNLALLSGGTKYNIFLCDDIIPTAMRYLQQDPPRGDKAVAVIANWLKLEQFVAANQDLASPDMYKGWLVKQIVSTTTEVMYATTEDYIPIMEKIIEIIRACAPAANNIWVRMMMNAINLCFSADTSERFDIALMWVQQCVEKLKNPRCSFHTEYASETKLDQNRNNAIHRLCLVLNKRIMDLIAVIIKIEQMDAREVSYNDLRDRVDAMLNAFEILFSSDCAILNAQLQDFLAQENCDRLTPKQMLMKGLGNDGREPVGTLIAKDINSVFEKYFPSSSTSPRQLLRG